MLRIDKESKGFQPLEQRSLRESGLLERYDVQKMIRSCSEPFFQEMGEELLLIGEEIRPSDFVDDRVDLLAVDKQGAVVVVELKRGSDRYQLLQALSYASMIAKWEAESLGEALEATGPVEGASGIEQIEEFLDVGMSELNAQQRVILLAEAFDFEVLSASEWLSATYGVDIRCYRMVLSAEEDREYLSCTCVYPPPELKEHAIRRRSRAGTGGGHASWGAALESIENRAVADFFRRQLEEGREDNVGKAGVMFRVEGVRRWYVHARRKHAYVWQDGRFEKDQNYWEKLLGEGLRLGTVDSGRALRFFLDRPEQFDAFERAVTGDLANVGFAYEEPDEGPMDET